MKARLLFSSFLTVSVVLAQAVPAFAALPNDPLIQKQWYLGKIQAPTAWDTTTGSNDVVVAVLDTGVDFNHPDLAGNLWTNPGEIPGNGIDDDHNGFVDDAHGWDFVDNDNTPDPLPDGNDLPDPVDHGTVIAGVIGAVGNNGIGVAGINWHVKIMPVRILNKDGSGFSTDATKGIEYAVKNGAKVINLSFTGFDIDPEFEQAIRDAYDAGVTVVAAVGNQDGGGLDTDANPVYPACFKFNDEDPVLGVAASNPDDTKADFSNYGTNCTDITAPGVDIFNLSYQDTRFTQFTQAYLGGRDGTSIASPMVAGAAALLLGAFPTLTPADVKTVIQLSADPMLEKGTPSTGKLGAGRLNLARMLEVGKALAAQKAGGAVAPTPSPVSTSQTSIVVAANAGQAPFVSVYDQAGNRTATFEAYADAFRGGVRVAVGDVFGNGQDDIITVPGPGGGPQVRVFSMDGKPLGQFFAFDAADRHGLYVAAGDVDGDGKADIVVGNDTGGGGNVRAFRANGAELSSFKPFDGEADRGIRVAVADVNGNGHGEIVATKGDGSTPRVRVLSSAGAIQAEFLAYASTFTRGVFVAGADLDGDGTQEIVVGSGVGGGPQVREFVLATKGVHSFFAFDSSLRGGVRVAAAPGLIVALPGPGEGTRVREFDRDGSEVGGFALAPSDAGAGSIATSSR
jgi:hypothetical protein